jgi:hypothetical protein
MPRKTQPATSPTDRTGKRNGRMVSHAAAETL